jgi:hypothetical protein
MGVDRFRLVAGVLVVVSHVVLCIAGYAILLGRVESDKILPTMLILTPLLGVFSAQVVSYATDNMVLKQSRSKINPLFPIIFFVLIFGHLVLIGLIFHGYAYSGYIGTVEDMQKYLGMAEAAFGFLVGLMVTGAFGPKRGE